MANKKRITRWISVVLTFCLFFNLNALPTLAYDLHNEYQDYKVWQEMLDPGAATAAKNTFDEDSPGINSSGANALKTKEDQALKNQKYKTITANKEYKTDRFIIKYKDENGLKEAINSLGKTVRESKVKNKGAKINVLRTNELLAADDLLASITQKGKKDEIEYIQPDYEMMVAAADPLLDEQWGHYQNDNPQAPDEEPYRMDANVLEAWETTRGQGALIAVLDTGIDITHEDLANSIWENTGEITGNGLDDDGNGYLDDVYGWDFFNRDNTVNDLEWKYDQWHGTHVAGIIAAEADNNKGIAGVAPEAKILPIKVFQGGTAYTSDIIEAIQYAEAKGAKVVNASWGSLYENPALKEAISSSTMLFACATGNNLYNLDNYPVYPAAYSKDLDNVISVASLNKDGRLSRFSNFGPETVDIAAPGEGIISTWLDNGYNTLNGTSMAAGHVTGVAALLLSKNSQMSAAEVKERIVISGDQVTGLLDKVTGGKKLNCGYAVSDLTEHNPVVMNIPDEPLPEVTPNGRPEEEYILSNAENYIDIKADMPTARHGLGVATVGGKIYAIGGQTTTSGGYSDAVEQYDPTANKWVSKQKMPRARSYFGIAVVNDKIYAIGGYNGSYLDYVDVYNPATNTWSTNTQRMPAGMRSFTATACEDKIYVIGGYNGSYRNTVYEYDILTDTWTQKSNMSYARAEHAAFYHNGKVYISGGCNSQNLKETESETFDIANGNSAILPGSVYGRNVGVIKTNERVIAIGGSSSSGSGFTNAIHSKTLSSNSMISSAHMVFPRAALGTVLVNGKVYIIGGRGSSDVFSLVEEMDLGWVDKGQLPKSISGFQSASLNGMLYMLGGITDMNGVIEKTKGVYEYNPNTGEWQQKADMPDYITDYALATAYGKIYLFGGRVATDPEGSTWPSSSYSDKVYEYDSGQDKWTEKASMSSPRSNFSTVFWNGKVYIAGGINESGILQTVQTYDPITNTWGTKANLPVANADHYLTIFDEQIYMMGGSAGKIYTYDSALDTWQNRYEECTWDTGNILVTLYDNVYSFLVDNQTIPEIYQYNYQTNVITSYRTFNFFGKLLRGSVLDNKVYLFTGDSDYANRLIVYTPPVNPWIFGKSPGEASAYGGSAVIGNNIYCVGGLNSSFEPLARLKQYNSVTDSWQTKASMRNSRSYLGVCAVNNKLYAIGGQDLSSLALNYVEEYDPVTDTWTTKANIPVATADMGIASANGKIYIFGGINSSDNTLNTVREYNPTTNTWATKASMPTARYACKAAAINGKIYVIGGIDSSGVTQTTVQMYDPVANTWTTKASMPVKRSEPGIAAGNSLYVVGGRSGGNFMDTVYEYRPSLDKWFTWPGPNVLRSDLDVALIDDRLFAINGRDNTNYYNITEFTLLGSLNAEYLHMGKEEVNLSGNFSRTYTDMEVPAPGFTIKVSRTYNSKDDRTTGNLISRGWTFGLQGKLDVSGNDTVVRLPDGSGQTFKQNIDGSYTAKGSRSTLVKQADGSYVLTTKDQYTYGFNNTGYLIWMKDRNGNTINITVNASGQITGVTDQAGRSITITYTSGRISKITDPIGRYVSYYYDTSGYLNRVTDPVGNNTYYEYDSLGYLCTIKDHNNNDMEYISYFQPEGEQLYKVWYTINSSNNEEAYQYNNNEGKLTVTDSNNRVRYTWYDKALYPVKVQDAEGRLTKITYNLENGLNKYGEERIVIDRNGNTTYYDRDNRGNITRKVHPDGSAVEYSYDGKNNLISEKDGDGRLTFYVYDANKINLLKKAQPSNGTDIYTLTANQDAFAITDYSYYTAAEAQSLFGRSISGLLKTETDPLGNTTTYTYDNRGNIASSKDSLNRMTTFQYNTIGWLKQKTTPANYTTKYYYDKNGSLLKLVQHGGETERFIYDYRGNVMKHVLPKQYSASGDTTTFTVENVVNAIGAYSPDHGYRYTYNGLSQLISEKDPLDMITNYSYDLYNNKTRMIKPNGPKYFYEYDVMNRLIKTSTIGTNVVQVSAGVDHSMALLVDGTVIAWGNNDKGQLGLGDRNQRVSPVIIPGLYGVKQVCAGDKVSLAVMNDGSVKIWGYNYYDSLGGNGQDKLNPETVPNLNNVKQVTSGIAHFLALLDNGTVMAWGRDEAGALGLNSSPTNEYKPPTLIPGLTDVKQIDAAWLHSFAVLNNGTVRVWGSNGYGALGLGSIVQKYTPYTISGLSNVSQISTSEVLTQVVLNDGTVKSWGQNASGQLGLGYATESTSENPLDWGKPTPQTVPEIANAQILETASIASYVVRSPETMWLVSCGSNSNNLLGRTIVGTYSVSYESTGLRGVKQISNNGGSHTMALLDDGTIRVWGKNDKGQLGIGTSGGSSLPVQPNLSLATQVLEEYSYGILSNGKTTITKKQYFSDTGMAETVSTYDYADRLIRQDNPDGAYTATSYNSNGTVKSKTDARENTTHYSYDGLNRLTATWSPLEEVNGTVKYAYSGKEYNKAGWVTKEISGKTGLDLNIVPEASDTAWTLYTYYVDGKTQQKTVSSGGKTEYAYDVSGNISKEEQYTSAEAKNTIEYTYNHLAKLTQKRVYVQKRDIFGQPETSELMTLTSNYTYDPNGNLLTFADANNITTTYTYDQLNRLLTTSRPGVNELGSPVTITSSNLYDRAGNLTAKTDENGATTRYTYNSRGDLSRVVDPNNGITFYAYDRAGRKIAEVQPSHYLEGTSLNELNRTEFAYDQMGRLMRKIYIYLEPGATSFTSITAEAYEYDANGNMVLRQDAQGYNAGYGTEYSYDLANRQTAILDPVNKDRGIDFTVQYQYDALGRKMIETDANGIETIYTYNDQGNLLTKTVDGILTQSNTYDLAGNQLTATDGNGKTTVIAYNALNKVKQKTLPGDSSIDPYTITYKYTPVGLEARELDSLGKETLFTYDNQERKLTQTERRADLSQSITTSIKYDMAGNIRYQIDGKGNYTEFTYDPANRCTAVIARGNSMQGTPIQRKDFTYDKNGNKLTETDLWGNTYTYIYDPLNRLIEKKDPNNKRMEKLVYNENNAQIASIDALENAKEFTYDKNNRLVETEDPRSTSENPIFISQTYDNAGNSESKTDGNGNVTNYTYDEYNRLITVENALGETTSYTYDPVGNMLTQTDGKGNTTTFEYNVRNLPVRKTDSGGITEENGILTYDPDKTETYTYQADGKISQKIDRNSILTQYVYDTHDRLTSEIVGTDEISYTYDNNGNQLTMTDATGTTTRTYDSLNRVLTKTVPVLGTTTFVYDLTNGLPSGYVGESTTDPKGHTVNKIKDKAGRLYQVKDGTTVIAAYTYYNNGSLQKVQYTGSSEEYTYYPDNRLHTQANKIGETIIEAYNYSYDGAGNQISKQDAKGITVYTHDELNRLSTATEPGGKITAYTYDAAGNRETETITIPIPEIEPNEATVPDNTEETDSPNITEETDSLDTTDSADITDVIPEPDNTTDPTVPIVEVLDSSNSIESSDDPSNTEATEITEITTITYTYNEQNRLVKTEKTLPDSTVITVNYTYDNNGNMLSQSQEATENNVILNQKPDNPIIDNLTPENQIPPEDQTISEEQLTSEEQSTQEKQTTSEEQTPGTSPEENLENPENSEIINEPGSNPTLDESTPQTPESEDPPVDEPESPIEEEPTPEQNMEPLLEAEQSPTIIATYQYDTRNRLIQVSQGDNVIENTYNGEGMRIAKIVNGQTLRYLYEYDRIILETNGTGSETARNIYGTNLLRRSVDGQSLDYLYNGHGDVTALISGSTVIAGYYYDAFGVLVEETGSANNPYRYAGYEYDVEVALYNLKARFYEAGIARFLQEDTYRGDSDDPLSLNLYTYCSNNPLIYFDPTGHWKQVYENGGYYEIAEKGDTVWYLAQYYTGNGVNWKQFYSGDPSKLQIGTKINVTKWMDLPRPSSGKTSDPTTKPDKESDTSKKDTNKVNSPVKNSPSQQTSNETDEMEAIRTEINALLAKQQLLKFGSQGMGNNTFTTQSRPTLSQYREQALKDLNNRTLEANRINGLVDDAGRPFMTKEQAEFNELVADIIVYGNVAMLGGAALESAGKLIAPLAGKIGSFFGNNKIPSTLTKEEINAANAVDLRMQAQRGIGGKGWRGDSTWKSNVNTIKDGGTIEKINGAVPSQKEAIDLINASGGKVIRIENAHPAGGISNHTYPHINYTTPSGIKGTIQIQGVVK